MCKSILVLLALVGLGSSTSLLKAAGVTVEIDVKTATRQVSAGSSERAVPTSKAKAGDTLSVKWLVTIPREGLNFPAAALSGATMHAFLDRESAVSSAKPSKDAVYESAVILSFDPASTAGGEFHIAAPPPGIYLLRVEFIPAGQSAGNQTFAALRIQVQ